MPLNQRVPSRTAGKPLASPFCEGRLLKDRKIHPMQDGWMEGRKADQPSSIEERIVAVCLHVGLLQQQFASVIGESREALNDYEHGTAVLLRVLTTIVQKLQVNGVSVETGVGTMQG